MAIVIRKMEIDEAEETGKIIVQAFNDVFIKHGLPAPFQSWQAGQGIAYGYAGHDPEGCLVATENGKIIGSGFIHLRGDKASIGPMSVSPEHQNKGLGRAIMEALLKIGSKASSIRLIQDSFNTVSFSLYTKIGFQARDVVLSLLLREPADYHPPSRSPAASATDNREIRLIERKDLPKILELDKKVMGFDREKDFNLLINQGVGFQSRMKNSHRTNGFIFCYPYREKIIFLGPGVALNLDYLRDLLIEILQQNKGACIRVKMFASHPDLARFLLDAGFQIIGLGTFMVRGNYERPPGRQLLAQFPELL